MFSLLYMRSASDDLTARARIRDAAIAAFARSGFDAVSMRAIAADADVSPALIVHHFGDKAALRTVCDDYVVSVFTDENHDLVGGPTADRMRAALNDLDRYAPYIDYLARMLTDDSPAANHLFDTMLAATGDVLEDQRSAGLLEPMSDPAMTTLLITLLGLGHVVMRGQIARALGEDQLSTAGLLRATLPTMELLTHGIYATDAFLEGTRAAVGADAESRPTETDRSETDDSEEER